MIEYGPLMVGRLLAGGSFGDVNHGKPQRIERNNTSRIAERLAQQNTTLEAQA